METIDDVLMKYRRSLTGEGGVYITEPEAKAQLAAMIKDIIGEDVPVELSSRDIRGRVARNPNALQKNQLRAEQRERAKVLGFDLGEEK